MYEYAAEVIVYLKEKEKVHVLRVNFMDGGSTNVSMRAMLVDWIIQVLDYSSIPTMLSLIVIQF